MKKNIFILILILTHLLCVFLGFHLGVKHSSLDMTEGTTMPTEISIATEATEQPTATEETAVTTEVAGESIEEPEDVPVHVPPITEPPVTQPTESIPPITQPPATEPPATEPPVTAPPATEPPAPVPPTPENGGGADNNTPDQEL